MIEQGLPGFAGGWISAIQLDRMLTERHLAHKLPRNKRKRALESMGYVQHPALHGGRVNNSVTPDNAKPVLYVRRDSLAMQITDQAAVARTYEAANTGRAALPFALAR